MKQWLIRLKALLTFSKTCAQCGTQSRNGHWVRDTYKDAPKIWLCEENDCFSNRRGEVRDAASATSDEIKGGRAG